MMIDFELEDLTEFEDKEVIKDSEDLKLDWLKQRRGIFTASEFFKLMTYEKQGVHLPQGALTYAKSKAVEKLTTLNPTRGGFQSSAMEWGITKELDAIAAFTTKTGIHFEKTGQNQELIFLNADIAGTPDGINHKSGIEVKCPSSATHYDYCLFEHQEHLKKSCPDYYWQIQGLMMITGFDNWYFVSFDPDYLVNDYQLKWLAIERNQTDIDHLKARLDLAIQYRNECVDRFLKVMV